MILLTERPPRSIEAFGTTWEIETDFRVWITFPEMVEDLKHKKFEKYNSFFLGDAPIPTEEVLNALNDFYYTPPEIPRDKGTSEPLISYKYDADYIYAGFLQAYGIDLVEEPLHWWKFLALLKSLPEDTMISKIIGYRGYSGTKKTNPAHAEYMKLKQAWSLPTEYSEEEKKQIEKFESIFGGC